MTARSPHSLESTRGDEPSAGANCWRLPAGWREVLAARRPEDLLERLLDGDPLGLRGLASQVLRTTARFVDADRVVLRALARICHGATLDGVPASHAWIVREVEAAVDDIVEEERTTLRQLRGAGEAPTDAGKGAEASTFAVLAGPLGVRPEALRRSCDAFNRRPFEERAAFFALVIEHRELDEAARACGLNPSELGRRARRALDAILRAAGSARGDARRSAEGGPA